MFRSGAWRGEGKTIFRSTNLSEVDLAISSTGWVEKIIDKLWYGIICAILLLAETHSDNI